MDTINFRLNAFKFTGDENPTAVADIFINGLPLTEKICSFESRAGFEVIAHASIPVAELYENLSAKYKVEAAPILGCDCGATLCWPVFVTVEICAENVVWKNFVLPQADSPKNFGEFVFDREQYFREVNKLRRWTFDEKLTVEYGGVAGGDLTLVVKKNAQAFPFYYDELLDDPLPALVKFFNATRGDKTFFETEIKDYDDEVDFKISFKPWTDGQLIFTVELIRKKIIFCEVYRRDELAAMFKRIFDALLNDKYFPYSYSCFWYIGESGDSDGEITDAIEAEHPDWSFGDVLNYAVDSGQLKLLPRYEEFLSKYKRMLTDFVVPEGWR